MLGAQYVHGAVAFSDINDVPPENITTTTNSRDGATTNYLVPTPQLPLTQPLRTVLPDQTVDQIDTVVRPVVDAGTRRNDNPMPSSSVRCSPAGRSPSPRRRSP